MSIDQWQTFSMVVFGTYVAGKTVSGVAYAITSRPEAMAPESKLDVAAKLVADLLPTLMPAAPRAAEAPIAVGFPTDVPEPTPAPEAAAEPSADDVDTNPQRKPAVL